MYKELIFSNEKPCSNSDGHVGGGVKIPLNLEWPKSTDGIPLVHLMSMPIIFFDDKSKTNHWISIFVPFSPGEVTHYRKLRFNKNSSEAVVLIYLKGAIERQESKVILEEGTIKVRSNPESDDSENLASKVDGIDAWLQSSINIPGFERRLSIYGGDLDEALPSTKGLLSDGMGYLFLPQKKLNTNEHSEGLFFIQLG